MRRNAEDLIVLSGAEPARRWSQPVPLVDVVRAALAEVEDYNRVELLPIDDIGVAGQAVSDVVHLLAELIENATSFSPPGTKVQVAGQQVSNGYVLEIEDRGLGMSDDELVEANERLANPPMVDFALSRMLGLYVVARLAQRYNIKVQLRHSWYGGITALVLLPPTVAVRAPMPEAIEAPSRLGPGRAGRLGEAGRAGGGGGGGGGGGRRAPSHLRGGPVRPGSRTASGATTCPCAATPLSSLTAGPRHHRERRRTHRCRRRPASRPRRGQDRCRTGRGAAGGGDTGRDRPMEAAAQAEAAKEEDGRG